MEVRGSFSDNNDKRYTPKKQTFNETRSKNNNPKMLSKKSKPDDGMIELEGGFTMYPSEILDFYEATDSWTY